MAFYKIKKGKALSLKCLSNLYLNHNKIPRQQINTNMLTRSSIRTFQTVNLKAATSNKTGIPAFTIVKKTQLSLLSNWVTY